MRNYVHPVVTLADESHAVTYTDVEHLPHPVTISPTRVVRLADEGGCRRFVILADRKPFIDALSIALKAIVRVPRPNIEHLIPRPEHKVFVMNRGDAVTIRMDRNNFAHIKHEPFDEAKIIIGKGDDWVEVDGKYILDQWEAGNLKAIEKYIETVRALL